MNKDQAAGRDRRHAEWKRMGRYMKKISSSFMGCINCGEFEMRTTKNGKPYKFWYQPGDVYKSYYASKTGWSEWCFECGAKDGKCWNRKDSTMKRIEYDEIVDPIAIQRMGGTGDASNFRLLDRKMNLMTKTISILADGTEHVVEETTAAVNTRRAAKKQAEVKTIDLSKIKIIPITKL